MKHIIIILTISSLFLYSCANLAMGIAAPNKCKKCEVYNTGTSKVLKTFEGCGANNVGLERSAKIAAYEIMEKGNCQIRVRCETWTQESNTE